MRRSLGLTLNEFGRSTIEIEAERHAVTPSELVGYAAEYYLTTRGADRAAGRVPRFLRAGTEQSLELAVDLAEATWEQIDSESERQGVPVELLLGHAVLHLVADLDSGEVATRLAATREQ